jgi:hypothetical protein
MADAALCATGDSGNWQKIQNKSRDLRPWRVYANEGRSVPTTIFFYNSFPRP